MRNAITRQWATGGHSLSEQELEDLTCRALEASLTDIELLQTQSVEDWVVEQAELFWEEHRPVVVDRSPAGSPTPNRLLHANSARDVLRTGWIARKFLPKWSAS